MPYLVSLSCFYVCSYDWLLYKYIAVIVLSLEILGCEILLIQLTRSENSSWETAINAIKFIFLSCKCLQVCYFVKIWARFWIWCLISLCCKRIGLQTGIFLVLVIKYMLYSAIIKLILINFIYDQLPSILNGFGLFKLVNSHSAAQERTPKAAYLTIGNDLFTHTLDSW